VVEAQAHLDCHDLIRPPDRLAWAEGWERCLVEEGGERCLGIATLDGRCLAHLDIQDAQAQISTQIKNGILDARGVTITEGLFTAITRQITRHQHDQRSPFKVTFTAAVFPFDADFFGWEFGEAVSFNAADFRGKAKFGGAVFRQPAWFEGARFVENAEFDNVVCHAEVSFAAARFCMNAIFHDSRLRGPVRLDGALVVNDLDFSEAELQGNQWLGPIAILGQFDLVRAEFHGDLAVEASGGVINLDSTRLAETLTMRLRSTVVSIETVVLARPSLIASSPPLPELGKYEKWIGADARARRGASDVELPRIESLRYANVEALTLANVDLRACRFAGVRNLDRLRLEGNAHFEPSPRWRSRRRVIAEEHEWRAQRRERNEGTSNPLAKSGDGRSRQWNPRECEVCSEFVRVDPVAPAQLAAIYRALRKSLEDSKDAPGAADFYYGEMEMRRHSTAAPLSERILIAAYWLFSGYGLRASRSLLALLLVIVGFGWLFTATGFEYDESLFEGLLASMHGAALLPFNDGPELSHSGEAMQIALRVLGPLFAGLTLLAIRARIKR
jgi:uncharacterized protein YjbI with pentapeptide repeats